jgi:uncharacterized protein (TIGR02147 family)
MKPEVDVFRYLDYRKLLRDFYRVRKAESRGFSYRWFSRRAGFRSPNHLKRVIEGERNLTPQSIEQYASALGLRGERANYFAALVRFNQSKTREDRETAYERMRSFRGYRRAQRIDSEYAQYHAHWYVPAVREMAQRTDFEPRAEWIAPRLRPAIRIDEAELALDILFELGMLVRDEAGRVTQAEPIVTTGPQTRGIHISRYHRAMLERASESISLVAAEERFISALTFCVGAAGFERVVERVQRFRSELIAMLSEETEGEQVLQLGIQVFPLTTKRGKD